VVSSDRSLARLHPEERWSVQNSRQVSCTHELSVHRDVVIQLATSLLDSTAHRMFTLFGRFCSPSNAVSVDSFSRLQRVSMPGCLAGEVCNHEASATEAQRQIELTIEIQTLLHLSS
jgi:hypothetical protein